MTSFSPLTVKDWKYSHFTGNKLHFSKLIQPIMR